MLSLTVLPASSAQHLAKKFWIWLGEGKLSYDLIIKINWIVKRLTRKKKKKVSMVFIKSLSINLQDDTGLYEATHTGLQN